MLVAAAAATRWCLMLASAPGAAANLICCTQSAQACWLQLLLPHRDTRCRCLLRIVHVPGLEATYAPALHTKRYLQKTES
jgi:hypothetical protein